MTAQLKRVPPEASLGERFGKLLVTSIFPGPRRAMATAQCDCGQTWVGILNRLRTGNTQSCGCDVQKFEDLTGQRFTRWVALECVRRNKPTVWRVECECGSIRDVQAGALKNGMSKSCGCLADEVRRTQSLKHGMTLSNEYKIWGAVKRRVFVPTHKDYPNYGGRGITMCQEWADDFMAFYNHVGPRPSKEHSLERADNEKGYEPGNVTWQTIKVQANNSRGNHLITRNGVTLTMVQWCEKLNLNYHNVSLRINIQGWSEDRALSTPTNRPFSGSSTRKAKVAE